MIFVLLYFLIKSFDCYIHDIEKIEFTKYKNERGSIDIISSPLENSIVQCDCKFEKSEDIYTFSNISSILVNVSIINDQSTFTVPFSMKTDIDKAQMEKYLILIYTTSGKLVYKKYTDSIQNDLEDQVLQTNIDYIRCIALVYSSLTYYQFSCSTFYLKNNIKSVSHYLDLNEHVPFKKSRIVWTLSTNTPPDIYIISYRSDEKRLQHIIIYMKENISYKKVPVNVQYYNWSSHNVLTLDNVNPKKIITATIYGVFENSKYELASISMEASYGSADDKCFAECTTVNDIDETIYKGIQHHSYQSEMCSRNQSHYACLLTQCTSLPSEMTCPVDFVIRKDVMKITVTWSVTGKPSKDKDYLVILHDEKNKCLKSNILSYRQSVQANSYAKNISSLLTSCPYEYKIIKNEPKTSIRLNNVGSKYYVYVTTITEKMEMGLFTKEEFSISSVNDCFVDYVLNGYIGIRSATKSGKKCDKWSNNKQYKDLEKSNWCTTKLANDKLPWCMQDNKREGCSIPKYDDIKIKPYCPNVSNFHITSSSIIGTIEKTDVIVQGYVVLIYSTEEECILGILLSKKKEKYFDITVRNIWISCKQQVRIPEDMYSFELNRLYIPKARTVYILAVYDNKHISFVRKVRNILKLTASQKGLFGMLGVFIWCLFLAITLAYFGPTYLAKKKKKKQMKQHFNQLTARIQAMDENEEVTTAF